jgi:alpha/beta superfamily hydrolase
MRSRSWLEVASPDYGDLSDPDARAERLLSLLRDEPAPVALCGSSMGGYVSLVTSYDFSVLGLFLLAPALYLPSYKQQSFSASSDPIEIVHGWNDDVVPVENSLRFAREQKATLHLVNDDHRLSNQLDKLGTLFSSFLRSLPRSPSGTFK